MGILWIWDKNRGGFFYCENKGEDADSFRKHKESMKRFRETHPEVIAPKPREVTETARPENSRRADLVGIVMVPRVQLGRYAQN